jgi:Flp pilus assembly pilin Flp
MTRAQKRTVGQGMTEYLIIVALIAISAIAIIRTTGNSLKVAFGKVANALQGSSASPGRAGRVTSAKTQGRSLNDFNEGVASDD